MLDLAYIIPIFFIECKSLNVLAGITIALFMLFCFSGNGYL